MLKSFAGDFDCVHPLLTVRLAVMQPYTLHTQYTLIRICCDTNQFSPLILTYLLTDKPLQCTASVSIHQIFVHCFENGHVEPMGTIFRINFISLFELTSILVYMCVCSSIFAVNLHISRPFCIE